MISLDDFGTGQSSLSYISAFPIDELKIDNSFVDKIPSSDKDRSLLTTTIELAHRLPLTVLAEGVDSAKKLKSLGSNGCDIYQRFIFAPAPSVPEFTKAVNSLVYKLLFPKQTESTAQARVIWHFTLTPLLPLPSHFTLPALIHPPRIDSSRQWPIWPQPT